uniref:hypothetical protein n=1 Tax=Candidatus Planktophila dulcis TaxID=1884914 RepID=UPI003CF37959
MKQTVNLQRWNFDASMRIIPILLLVLSKILTWLAFPSASLHPDSSSYSTGSSWNFSLVSFTGHSGRPWPVTFFFALFPDDSLRILAQLILSTAVWVFLMLTISKLGLARKSQFALSCFISAIGASPLVTQWDTTILGTSLMISNSVLIVALVIRMLYIKKFQRLNFILLISVIHFFYLQKFSNLPFVLILVTVVFYWTWSTTSKKLRVGAVVATIIVFAWGTVMGININNSWEKSYSGSTLLWQLGSQSPTSLEFRTFLSKKADVPRCIYLEAPYRSINESIAKISNSCPESSEYLRGRFQKDFIEFVVKSPQSVTKLISIGVGASFSSSSSHYGSSVSLFPSVATALITGELSPDLRFSSVESQEEAYLELSKGEPKWLHLPIIGFVCIALLLLILRLRNQAKKKDIVVGIFFILTNLIQLGVNFVLLPSEWVRQGAPFVISLLGFSVISIVISFSAPQSNFSEPFLVGKTRKRNPLEPNSL